MAHNILGVNITQNRSSRRLLRRLVRWVKSQHTKRIAAGRRSVTLNGSKTDSCSAHQHIGKRRQFAANFLAPIGRAHRLHANQLYASGSFAAWLLQRLVSRVSIRSDACIQLLCLQPHTLPVPQPTQRMGFAWIVSRLLVLLGDLSCAET